MLDFIVSLISHPAVDHVCALLAGFKQPGGLRFIELNGLVNKGLAQIHF